MGYDVPALRNTPTRNRIGFKPGYSPSTVANPNHDSIPKPWYHVFAGRLIAEAGAADASAEIPIMLFGQAKTADVRGLQRYRSMPGQWPAAIFVELCNRYPHRKHLYKTTVYSRDYTRGKGRANAGKAAVSQIQYLWGCRSQDRPPFFPEKLNGDRLVSEAHPRKEVILR